MLGEIYRERITYFFLLPILLLYFVFSIIPILQTFRLSFYDAKILRLGKFMGFENYATLVTNPDFVQAFRNTFVFTTISVVFILVVSLSLAVLVNLPFVKFRTLFKALFFLPVVTSPVAVGYIWKWIFEPTLGILNALIKLFGFQAVNWLSDPNVALNALIFVNVWKWIGYFMVIFLTNLQAIDPGYYEAASIDGASGLQQFWFITLPLLKSSIILSVILGFINFLKTFALVFVMTQGGPAGQTEMMVTYVWKEAFGTQLFRFGFASAASMVLFGLIMICTIVLNLFGKEEG